MYSANWTFFIPEKKFHSLNFIDWKIVQSRRGALKNESIILPVLNGYMKDVNKNLTWVQNRTHTWTDGIISVKPLFDKVFLQKYIRSSFSLYYIYCNKIIKHLMSINILSEQSSEEKITAYVGAVVQAVDRNISNSYQ